MSDRSLHPAIFVVDRTFGALPHRVFRAWTELDARGRWFAGRQGWETTLHELDARPGGTERLTSTPPGGGPPHAYEAAFVDVVADERLVLMHSLRIGDLAVSASVAAVELKPASAGTRVVYTEQAAFLDGIDNVVARKNAMIAAFDRLEAELLRDEPAT